MSPGDPDFEALLGYLSSARGFDFSGYKRATLGRRITKRMSDVHIEGYADYVDYLEVHPDEFAELFNTILINVTSFFRDAEAWEVLSSELLPMVISEKGPDDQIRVWSAACASGEEAYSAAIVLAEALGVEDFRRRVKIYATDIDDEALSVARHGEYPLRQFSAMPERLVDNYFEPSANGRQFRADLRRAVIFGRQDLIQDAPISRLDLLICRNALMYFNAETQSRIIDRFHFALKDTGILFLGRAEMLLSNGHLFRALNVGSRMFAKIEAPELRDGLVTPADGADGGTGPVASELKLGDAAFDAMSMAGVVVGAAGRLMLANEQARSLLGLSYRDLGRPFQDLELSYRPVELRTPIEEAQRNGRRITLPLLERLLRNGERQYLEVCLTPLYDETGASLGVVITFEDVTAYRLLQADLERSNQDLETASEELQSTNEELETANEELQSSIEELETTNEELQSANEELEAMNEELESTNEELQAINDELRERSEDYDRVSSYLGSILGSIRVGVVVVDGELTVRSWNRRSEDLWGLRADEAEGQQLLSLDIGLPVSELQTLVRTCLDGSAERHLEAVIDAVNRRGRPVRCRVVGTPLRDEAGRRGVVLLMEDLTPE